MINLLRKIYRVSIGKNYHLNRLLSFFYGIIRGIDHIDIDDKFINIICPTHIGDIYYASSMRIELTKKYNKPVKLYIPKRYMSIKEIFDSDQIEFIPISKKNEIIINRMNNDAIIFFRKSRSYVIIDTVNRNKIMDFNNGIHMVDTIKKHYGINSQSWLLNRPSFINKNTQNLEKEFTKLKLEKKNTIMLFPEAETVNSFTNEDWLRFALELSKVGYKVCFNSKSNNYKNFPSIFLSIIDTISFIQLCGFMVALRSGFCDLVQTLKIKKLIIYPRNINIDICTLSYLDEFVVEKHINYLEEINVNEVKDYFVIN